jgi:hypothetical protein
MATYVEYYYYCQKVAAISLQKGMTSISNVQLLLFMRLNWTKLVQITALVQVKLRERSHRKKG